MVSTARHFGLFLLFLSILLVVGCEKERTPAVSETPESAFDNQSISSTEDAVPTVSLGALQKETVAVPVADASDTILPVVTDVPPAEPAPETPDTESKMVEELGEPVGFVQRFSYTYGYLLMATAMRDPNAIDPYYFARGVLDFGLQEKPFLSDAEMNNLLFEYQDKLIAEATAQLEELTKKNLETAEGFLAVNKAREGVITTESGLQYEVVKASEGVRPQASDSVKVNYTLTYLDGRIGDSSPKGVPSTFALPNLIPGFREGLMLMTVGSEYRFFLHPRLGYGASGSSNIEPNALLIFDVQLVEIVKK